MEHKIAKMLQCLGPWHNPTMVEDKDLNIVVVVRCRVGHVLVPCYLAYAGVLHFEHRITKMLKVRTYLPTVGNVVVLEGRAWLLLLRQEISQCIGASTSPSWDLEHKLHVLSW